MNAKARKRIKNSERRDYYKMLHREYDSQFGNRTVVSIVTDSIEIALGNPLLAMMTGTIY